jgi:uncharacterized protein YcbK (DUF882 family)
MMSIRLSSLVLAAGILFLSGAAHAIPTDSTSSDAPEAAFTVRFGNEVIDHSIMAVTVLPNDPIRIAVDEARMGNDYRIDVPDDADFSNSGQEWRFSAPDEPGHYPVTVTDPATNASVRIQVFVLTPWNHEERHLDGFRIGRYEQRARRGLDTYEPPAGFIEVTDETKNVRVSPNFRLKQFLCKQTNDTPQYALVEPRLLRRLETVLSTLRERGHDVSTLHVMSGFRTPYYNRAIGNTTEYSRHLYGDAADIFVDMSGNGRMDDLNGDGQVDRSDAQYLASIVRDVPTPGDDRFNGGLGVYGPAPHRGPFVHVDLRGYRARW